MKETYTNRLIWPAVAVLCGALCAIVRRWQLSSAFEGDLALPIPMAPATAALIALFVLCAAALLLLACKQPADSRLKQSPELALYAHNNGVFMGAMVAAAFLTLIAAPILFLDGRQMWSAFQAAKVYGNSIPGGNNGILVLVTAVTSALSFIALLVTAKSAYRTTKKGRMGILMPVINGCLWLMEIYRGHAANPVRWDYAPLLIAIVCGILMFLDWAGLYAGPGAPRRTLWLAGLTIVFSAAALAGEWDLSSALLLTAQLIAALALLWCVPNNLRYPPELPVESAPAEEKLEEETHE